MSYTPLHLHTQYSLLDGAILIPDLMERLKELKITSCAITDHGWMAGIVDFYKQCKKNDIKPLIGVEAYVTDNEDNLSNEQKVRDNAHLILLAKDQEGYVDLLRLCSEAALQNFYYKPRISRDKLRGLRGHAIATTACLGGVVSKRLNYELDNYGRVKNVSDPVCSAKGLISWYQEVFQEDFYLEIQDWPDETGHQQAYNRFILDVGRPMGVPFVITSDAHYLKQEDHKLHELLMALQLKTTLDKYQDKEEMKYGPHFYVKTPDEMLEAAKHWGCEEAFHNTNAIAEKCNVEIELGVYKPPVFKIEQADDYEDFKQWADQRDLKTSPSQSVTPRPSETNQTP
jgi:DNA polymerase-3 subunit alpha